MISFKSTYCNINSSKLHPTVNPPFLSAPLVVCLSFPPSRHFPGRLRARPISHRTALWLAQEHGQCDSVTAHLTEDTHSHTQHFGKQAPLFFSTFCFLLKMMGLVSKHETLHAVSMFTQGGDEEGWGHSVYGCKQKLEKLLPEQIILLLPQCLNSRTMCCATMESNALIYLPSFELGNTSHI